MCFEVLGSKVLVCPGAEATAGNAGNGKSQSHTRPAFGAAVPGAMWSRRRAAAHVVDVVAGDITPDAATLPIVWRPAMDYNGGLQWQSDHA